jgi:hypothetical protein
LYNLGQIYDITAFSFKSLPINVLLQPEKRQYTYIQ